MPVWTPGTQQSGIASHFALAVYQLGPRNSLITQTHTICVKCYTPTVSFLSTRMYGVTQLSVLSVYTHNNIVVFISIYGITLSLSGAIGVTHTCVVYVL